MHLGIVIDNIHERALLAILDGHVGDDELIVQRVHEQSHVDELLREELIVLVVKYGLQLRGARCIVDLVI